MKKEKNRKKEKKRKGKKKGKTRLFLLQGCGGKYIRYRVAVWLIRVLEQCQL